MPISRLLATLSFTITAALGPAIYAAEQAAEKLRMDGERAEIGGWKTISEPSRIVSGASWRDPFFALLEKSSFSAACVAHSTLELVQLAKENSPNLSDAIEETFSAKDLKGGTAWSGRLHDFFFAVRSSSLPTLYIDDAPGPQMETIAESDLWFAPAEIQHLGHPHTFHYQIEGRDFGGSVSLPAFGELSYPMPGVKQGTLSPKMIATSRIYDGMKAEWWIYVPAGYDPNVPAALIVFQDGGDTSSATAAMLLT